MSFTRKEYPEDAKRKSLSPSEAKVKIAAYCAYQERCQKEVRNKLYDYGLYPDEVEELLTTMILEGFVNEERFAKAFVGGKFRIKRWGRLKIRQQLKLKISGETLIHIALKEIDEQDYWNNLMQLAEKKQAGIKTKNQFERRMKLYQFLVYKGYESDLVNAAIQQIEENE